MSLTKRPARANERYLFRASSSRDGPIKCPENLERFECQHRAILHLRIEVLPQHRDNAMNRGFQASERSPSIHSAQHAMTTISRRDALRQSMQGGTAVSRNSRPRSSCRNASLVSGDRSTAARERSRNVDVSDQTIRVLASGGSLRSSRRSRRQPRPGAHNPIAAWPE